MINFVSDSSTQNDENKILQILKSANNVLQYSLDDIISNSLIEPEKLEDEIMRLITTENLLHDLLNHNPISNLTLENEILTMYRKIKETRMKKYFQYLSIKNI